jgi:hypothetical protein
MGRVWVRVGMENAVVKGGNNLRRNTQTLWSKTKILQNPAHLANPFSNSVKTPP